MKKIKHGFTLIELVFVIVVLGILAAAAIPKLAEVENKQKVEKFKAGLNIIRDTVKESIIDEPAIEKSGIENFYKKDFDKLTIEFTNLKEELTENKIALATERELNERLTAQLKISEDKESEISDDLSSTKDDFSISQY